MRGHALIIGAGIAGLTAGHALLQAGWSVEIRERSARPPTSGTALGMWPEAMSALDSIGFGDQIRARSIHQAGGAILRADGRVITRLSADLSAHLVTRPVLLETLADALPPANLRWNAGLRGGAEVEESDADVVIAADGIHSVVRAAAFGATASPRALGTVAFRGTVTGSASSITETWGRGRLFGITPNDADSTNWFACFRRELAPDHERDEDASAILKSMYAGWHPDVISVLDRTTGTSIDRRSLQDMPRLTTYVSGRTALVGDAAHAMAPNLGRGACESLVDAVELVAALNSEASVADALRRYDSIRRPAAGRIMRMSRLANRLSTTRRFSVGRDALLSAAGRFLGKTR